MKPRYISEVQYAMNLVIMILVFGGLLLISGTSVKASLGIGAILGIFHLGIAGIRGRIRR